MLRRAGIGLAGLALAACTPRGTAPPEQPGAAVADAEQPSAAPAARADVELDDLGDPRGEVSDDESLDRPLSEVANVEGVPVEHVDMDGDDPNGGPTEMVTAQPDREPSGSLIDAGMVSGPKG